MESIVPPTEEERAWGARASRYLKAELKRAGMTYGELSARMASLGFAETEASITNKLARGTLPAAFFLAALKATGVENVRISDI